MGNTNKRYFKNISAKSWEHPTDKAALSALQSIPGVDLLLKKVGLILKKCGSAPQNMDLLLKICGYAAQNVGLLLKNVDLILKSGSAPQNCGSDTPRYFVGVNFLIWDGDSVVFLVCYIPDLVLLKRFQVC